jgi:hypothetical protein
MGIPFVPWFSILTIFGIILGFFLKKAFDGKVIFNPSKRKVLYESYFLGNKSSSILCDFSQIQAIAVESITETTRISRTSNVYDSSSQYRIIALLKNGKVLTLSDFVNNESEINKIATQAGELTDRQVYEGEPSKKFIVKRMPNGKFDFVAEIGHTGGKFINFLIALVVLIILITQLSQQKFLNKSFMNEA